MSSKSSISSSSSSFSVRMTGGAVLLASVAALVIACGSSSDSTFNEGQPASNVSFENEGGVLGSSGADPGGPDGGNLYANDPPPKWCGPGGDPAPPPPGGTEQCPDDKNLPGCGCNKVGEKAKCWTGLRKHRGLGVCKDGETTCIQKNETESVWGPCVGEVLPTPGATKGAAACGCFSAGQWNIENLTPCTYKFCSPACQFATTSAYQDGTGASQCGSTNPPTQPTQDWSKDTLKVDCAGHFKLCLRIRAGVFETPSPNDCILGEVCTEDDYKVANVVQPWKNLPGWLGKDSACSQKWFETPDNVSPGYAEMIVKGQSVRCDPIDDGNGGDLVFNRVKYCPQSCNDPANAQTPECVACQQAGSGSF